jgi:hypothetical protein
MDAETEGLAYKTLVSPSNPKSTYFIEEGKIIEGDMKVRFLDLDSHTNYYQHYYYGKSKRLTISINISIFRSFKLFRRTS